MSEISVRTGDSADIEAFLSERIYEFNAAATGYHDGQTFAVVRRNDEQQIEGGACGHTWGGSCYVTYLWVSQELRGKGLGSELLTAVEEHARSRGCRLVFLSTHDFQAPAFYSRLGYQCVAQVENHPVAHASLYFMKQL